MRRLLFSLVILLALGCSDRPRVGRVPDAGAMGRLDGGTDDRSDGSTRDGSPREGGLLDGSGPSGRDAESPVADASSPDGARPDAGRPDAGRPDAGRPTGGCLSGAAGTHVARFRWEGSGPGSRAYVAYEANTLPDRSRWRASAASRSIGYSPVFGDPFLGEGGLDLSGSVFIDVELSTAGLSPGGTATLAIFGRSYKTTASGSFSWQTFSGTGATPSGSVSNVAPYRWYRADVTTALPAGDDSVLLRIKAGPPSGSLVVRRVEVCFNANP